MFMLTPGESFGHQKDYITPSTECMNNLLMRDNTDWTWIDAIQMGLPVLAKLERAKYLTEGKIYPQYMEKGWNMYKWTRDTLANGLYNPKEGLWWRDKDFVPPYKEPNGSNCYWSRGNGWVYAALVRTMDAMLVAESADNFSFFEPIDAEKWKKLPIESHFDDYLDDFKAMSEALLKCQRTDRFWNVSLHDESNYGGKELTGTSLFIYGMAWGVRHGYLNRSRFLPVIVDTWNAMVKKCVHRSGFLGYVQGTGKEPKDSQPVGYRTEPDFDDFGLGCFLLAGTEVFKLAD
jgi:rhamnogalacturonyl hydrolase YesR